MFVHGYDHSVQVLLSVVFVSFFFFASGANRPNIVFIVADDLGWNDVGFHGSDQILTPNIDALAYNGIILNGHYVQATGTATRAALLTGKYPIKLGMQGPSIMPSENISLPEQKIMPEYLKELGYDTYLIGKWGLGYSKWNDTPAYRGFDHHFGSFNTYSSYYDYLTNIKVKDRYYTGFDMRKDGEPAWDIVGTYATNALTDYAVKVINNQAEDQPLFMVISHFAPHAGNEGKFLEAPQETIEKFSYIIDANRRTYAAIVSKLDDSVGEIITALDKRGVLQNSVIVFLSDNGSPETSKPFPNWGSNYPLRGLKNTLFEGGVRSTAFVWSPLLAQNGRISLELVHVTDWLPTVYSAGGGESGLLDADLDGIDLWSSLSYDFPSPRNDILLNIDETTKSAGLRFYNWKLIVGHMDETKDSYDGETGKENIKEVTYNYSAVLTSPAGRAVSKFSPLAPEEMDILRQQATIKCLADKTKMNACNLSGGDICLFDIPNDPCEENNLSQFFPSVVRRMKRALVDYRSFLVPQPYRTYDIENGDPKYFQFTWNPWLECTNPSCSTA